MKYYDQHLHTYFSFDSKEQFKNYLINKPRYFVSTDHFDLHNPLVNFEDSIPNYELYADKLSELAQNYPTQFIKGIEIGVVPGQENKINEYLKRHPYDLKITSIHQNGKFDYMDDIVLQNDKFKIAKEYFEQMNFVLDKFYEGDILAHFDYGLRRFDFTIAELEQNFEPLLIQIFSKAIKLGMAFELNSKSFTRYHNENLYRYAVPLYLSLGGKSFTLDSDAHVAADYQLGFEKMAALLQEFKVSELTIIQGRERFQVPIPTKF
ncbi:PHP domain-containing protein [Xylocopilactobacillus apicola]|uniref:Histidinol-phosphatase n=1 Tax=Xylocopilactobacillus apicola TaxID=2932184 RepID=A0AAU9D2D0_9LACO|nr:PHP domain-containing protein [Xylocopilactobacillus apicola]BDR58941.1 hypothetical protein XA3_13820 [Xylocopilactobacillus apicola]